MLKFKDYPYVRPNIDEAKVAIEALIARISASKNFGDIDSVIIEYDALNRKLQTASQIGDIRFTLNTADEFYAAENDFFGEVAPIFGQYQMLFSKALLECPYRDEINAKYGTQYLTQAELQLKIMSPEVVPLMQEINKLKTEYQALSASCKVEFMGETCNTYGLLKYMEDPNRETRKAAFELWAGFLSDNEERLDEIYDQMVTKRQQIAEKLGYKTYTPVGYYDMGRADYGPNEVAKFREQVVKHIVPACVELRKRQAKRIGVEKLHYYDESYMFTNGNANPIGNRDYMVDAAQKMYSELSKESGEFFDFMVERELLELETKSNKAVGGYCTFLPDYNAPFIFSNFNGTSADVDVLTHEAGHAFEAYCASRNQELVQYFFSTSEVNEIHSMSMEYFTYPWMKLFFGDNAEKYYFSHLSDALTFIPYGVCVDEYQHIVYENPNLTPKERTAAWKELEKKYMPDRSYDGNEFLERGGFWMQKLHIFLYPFYYVDYTLASLGAFEFFSKMQTDHKKAWEDYYRLCCAGGSLPYLDLLKLANLSNPFEDGTVEKATSYVIKHLEGVDDLALQK